MEGKRGLEQLEDLKNRLPAKKKLILKRMKKTMKPWELGA